MKYHNVPFVDGRPVWEQPFLARLERSGNVKESARGVGISCQAVYKRRAAAPGFAERFKRARLAGILRKAAPLDIS